MSDYCESRKCGDLHFLKKVINKADLTRSERDITIRIINLWYYHRDGQEGLIRPGRGLLAKRCKCSVKTVSRCLSKLCRKEVLKIIANLKGGGNQATSYQVNEANLLRMCGLKDSREKDRYALEYYSTKPAKVIQLVRAK